MPAGYERFRNLPAGTFMRSSRHPRPLTERIYRVTVKGGFADNRPRLSGHPAAKVAMSRRITPTARAQPDDPVISFWVVRPRQAPGAFHDSWTKTVLILQNSYIPNSDSSRP